MTGPRPATVLIAHEHALFRAAIRAAFEAVPDMTVVAEAGRGDDAVVRVRCHRPDVVLVSDTFPGPPGGVCAKLRTSVPATKVVVVGDAPAQEALQAAIEDGAAGYVTNTMALADLTAAVRQVYRGHSFVPPSMLGALLRGLIERTHRIDRAVGLFARLTPREKEVLALLADGCDHASVADILVISPETARTHIQRIIGKLGVHSRLEAAAMAAEHGFSDYVPARGRR